MPLPTNEEMGASTGQGAQKYFISKTTVRYIADHSGEHFDFLRSAPDLALRLYYDVPGQNVEEWNSEPNILTFGDFAYEQERITGMGGAFTVYEIFHRLGIKFQPEQTESGFAIPERCLEEARGKPFVKLRYVQDENPNGGFYYNDFGRIGFAPEVAENHWDDDVPNFSDLDEAKQHLEELFLNQVENGYPNDYRPDLIDEDDMPHKPSGGSGPSGTQPAGKPEEDTFEPDDDLPF